MPRDVVAIRDLVQPSADNRIRGWLSWSALRKGLSSMSPDDVGSHRSAAFRTSRNGLAESARRRKDQIRLQVQA
jgi:hypothetical protein